MGADLENLVGWGMVISAAVFYLSLGVNKGKEDYFSGEDTGLSKIGYKYFFSPGRLFEGDKTSYKKRLEKNLNS